MLTFILVTIIVAASYFATVLFRLAKLQGVLEPRLEAIVIGGLVNFLDTLGIGSFAPTLSWLKLRARLPDRLVPCTMIVACTLPAMLQAAIFLTLLGLNVNPGLLVGYAIALLGGGLVGQRLVLRVRVWLVQIIVAIALLIAAALYALSNLHLMPAGGLSNSVPLPFAFIAIGVSFLLGILLNFGIGHYAPSLLMFSLMGMNPKLAFPIMATGGALAAVVISYRHLIYKAADLKIAISFFLGGIPGVLIATFVVKAIPVQLLRWLVIIVVIYAAALMIRDAIRGSTGASPEQ